MFRLMPLSCVHNRYVSQTHRWFLYFRTKWQEDAGNIWCSFVFISKIVSCSCRWDLKWASSHQTGNTKTFSNVSIKKRVYKFVSSRNTTVVRCELQPVRVLWFTGSVREKQRTLHSLCLTRGYWCCSSLTCVSLCQLSVRLFAVWLLQLVSAWRTFQLTAAVTHKHTFLLSCVGSLSQKHLRLTFRSFFKNLN